MPDKFSMSKGDWACPNRKCNNMNFARREKCNKCGEDKPRGVVADIAPEIGKSASDKSKGLFSANDWMCKSCGNVNWARRSICNVCNTPRVNTLGQRTGYGGGFMERDEVVEYRDREESDNEIDEFGIKKKKFRKSQIETNPPNSKEDNFFKKNEESEKEESEKENDDDDDDDNDGDLSKYDIWADDNEEAVGSSSSHSTSSSKQSGSSSNDDSSAYDSDKDKKGSPEKQVADKKPVNHKSDHNASEKTSAKRRLSRSRFAS